MHSHLKRCRNQADHQLYRAAPLMARTIVLSVILTAFVALSGCSTQSAVSSGNRRTEELAGPGESTVTPEGRIPINKKDHPGEQPLKGTSRQI
jgi:hypothetical protein